MSSDHCGLQIIELEFPENTHPLAHEANKDVLAFASKKELKIFLVGGYLRDSLLKRPLRSKDFDYAVAGASAFALARDYASHSNGHFVALDESSDTARVVLKDGTSLDFAGCVGGAIERDIWRRDFSINALYWDSEKPNTVIDLVGGKADLEKRSVRALSEEVLLEDPLRMLRAFRFASTLGFSIEKQTLEWISAHHPLLEEMAPERVTTELFLALAARQSQGIITQMADAGIFESIFPELTQTRGIPKNAYHHLNLFDHSVETVVQVEEALTANLELPTTDLNADISFGITRLAATKVAALLHDIGKPATWQVMPDGKHTFIGHDSLGAHMVSAVAERMHWSRPVEKFISSLVKWHLRPGQLFNQGTKPTDRAIFRFYRTCGMDVPELILLGLGDLGATQGPDMIGEKSDRQHRDLIELLERYNVFITEAKQKPKLLNGGDVMRILGINAGPTVGQILTALEEAQELKEITNRLQAESFVRSLYAKDSNR